MTYCFSIEWPMSRDTELHKQICPLYQRISVLTAFCRTSVSPVLFPCTKVITIALTLFCIFGSIRFAGRINIYAYICTPICGVVFLAEMMIAATYMARLHLYSSQIAKNCTAVKCETLFDTKVFQKSVVSYRAVRFNVGDLYFVDQGTMLNLVFLVFEQVINMLISM